MRCIGWMGYINEWMDVVCGGGVGAANYDTIRSLQLQLVVFKIDDGGRQCRVPSYFLMFRNRAVLMVLIALSKT